MLRSLTLTVAAATAIGALPAIPISAAPAPSLPSASLATGVQLSGVTASLSARYPDEQPKLKDTVTWADGATYARYERTWKGLPVVGGRYSVPVSVPASGSALNAKVGQPVAKAPIQATSTTPRLSAPAARQTGRAAATREASPGATLAPSTSSLVVYVGRDGVGRLAWDVFTEGADPKHGAARIHTYIDAQSGALLGKTNLVQAGTESGTGVYSGTVSFTTQPVGTTDSQLGDGYGNVTRDMKHQDVYNANFWKLGDPIKRSDNGDNIWGSGTLYSGDKQAVDTQGALETTYQYFLKAFGRRGEANDGKGTNARVHAGTSTTGCWTNATWDGYHINIGDGAGCAKPFSELDIVAHEVTHGVTYHSAGLEYELESGGLNEAMSDIFGMMVERYAAMNRRTTADPWDYNIGERLNFYGNNLPVRYMDKPSKDGYSYNCWSPRFAQRDASGNELVDVHYSSGPMNHAFYLLAEGSGTKTVNGVTYSSPTCNNTSFGGIGPDAAAKIVYRALTSPNLTSTATYRQFRDEMVRAAIATYGSYSSQCFATEKAMSAISVLPATGSPRCTYPRVTARQIFPRDVNGDSWADVLMVRPSDGYLTELLGTSTTAFTGPTATGAADYRTMHTITQTGQWDGLGGGDAVMVDSAGALWAYTLRKETGRWSARTKIGDWGWKDYPFLFSPGDMDGNGYVDLVGVDAAGDLWFYAHQPNGTISARRKIGSGWNVYTKIFTVGDTNGDGKQDFMAIDKAGALWLYAGTGAISSTNEGYRPRVKYGLFGWNAFTAVAGVGDINKDGRQDLVALDQNGTLWYYRNTGVADFRERYTVRTGLKGWRLVV